MYEIFNVKFSLLWQQLTPPILRQTVQLAWGAVLLKPLQYLRDLIFDGYANGSTYPDYSGATAYVVGDRVRYIDRCIYECILNTTGNAPTDVTYFRKVNDNFIGARERIRYNSQKIVFEYAINNWFMTTGIYVSNVPKSASTFVMGNAGEYSSNMWNLSGTATTYLTNAYLAPSEYDCTIYVPLAFYNSLDTTNEKRTDIIKSFADKYIILGVKYNVTTY